MDFVAVKTVAEPSSSTEGGHYALLDHPTQPMEASANIHDDKYTVAVGYRNQHVSGCISTNQEKLQVCIDVFAVTLLYGLLALALSLLTFNAVVLS